MLRRLTIEDYGLVELIEVDFAKGATIFTGETGSGKTMLLGALGFALGDRASVDAIRQGAPRARVTLEFDPSASMRNALSEAGFALDEDEDATLARELAQNGKSAVRVNGRAASASFAREIAGGIVDIVGQHEAQRLLSPAYHLELLDRFAGPAALVAGERVARAHAKRTEIARALQEAEGDDRRAQERYAFAIYARDEIDAAAVEPGEDERLAQRGRLLDNAEKVALALRAAHTALAAEEGCAADALGTAHGALLPIAAVAPEFDALAQSAAALQIEANDLALRIARSSENAEFDPRELEAINARRDVLDGLKRKYGGSVEALLREREEFARTVDAFERRGERRTELQRDLAVATAALQGAASELTALRRDAASQLRKKIEPELRALAITSARFDVQFTAHAEIGANGAESAQFIFSANKNEPQRPLVKAASGGELSRVLLGLIVVLAQARASAALVLDEIDAGIGGATAAAVGERIAALARTGQVICVTHLAQIASWAEAHYVLEKHEDRRGAAISARLANGEGERAEELARMLSGQTHDAALKHARTLRQSCLSPQRKI